MINHPHSKQQKKTKILLLIVFLIAFSLFSVLYLYNSKITQVNNTEPMAGGTPVIPESTTPTVTEPSIYINPASIQQGEPALITVEGLTSTSSIKSFTFNDRPLITFIHEGKITALLGIDLKAATGTFPLVLTLKGGKQIRKDFLIQPRPVIRAPFGIPEKLGGNTPESEKLLITTLNEEGKIINAIPKSKEKLWNEKFSSPLSSPLVVSDPFGYTRITGNFTPSHKGVDLKAEMGTPVYAMNLGIVKFASNLRNHGNMVVIDHGSGLQTYYLHLSEINTILGKRVEKGELIGKSGDTGYVLDPHLHLTVRIWGVSVDPIKFLEILGE